MPTVMSEYRKHLSEYYAPKNFNLWYIFGGLAITVLAIQIITGIFLVMHYKPDAALAFASVEYIMRDVPGGWFIRYMHSTGASFFFIVVYLHMFRGLMYGSYRTPRELVWIFGCLIFLCLMGEAFFGYLLPWGQMSYWGAQVIVNLFGAIPLIGPGPVDLDSRRLRDRRCDAEPLLLVPRDRDSAGTDRSGGRAHPGAARRRLQQPRRRRDQEEVGREWAPARRDSVPPVLHGARHLLDRGLPDALLRGALLRARTRWLLPRVEQLHPGRSAADPVAYRAGVVLHAVLFDPARDHRTVHGGACGRHHRVVGPAGNDREPSARCAARSPAARWCCCSATSRSTRSSGVWC